MNADTLAKSLQQFINDELLLPEISVALKQIIFEFILCGQLHFASLDYSADRLNYTAVLHRVAARIHAQIAALKDTLLV